MLVLLGNCLLLSCVCLISQCCPHRQTMSLACNLRLSCTLALKFQFWLQRACRQKPCACFTAQLPTAALCLFDITLLSTPPNYVAGNLRLSCTLALIFQSCVRYPSPVCMYLASTMRLSYFMSSWNCHSLTLCLHVQSAQKNLSQLPRLTQEQVGPSQPRPVD